MTMRKMNTAEMPPMYIQEKLSIRNPEIEL